MDDANRLLELAEATAREAGAVLKGGASRLRTVNAEEAHDVKLQADIESEKLICERLSAGSGLPIVGEEEGGDTGLVDGDELYWVVDPLDGTYNYLRDFPLCCVSIGLLRGEQPVLGTIYDFYSGAIYSGIVGEGFRVDGKAVKPVWAKKVEDAMIVTGFPAGRDFSEGALQSFVGMVQGYKKIRLLGSAALSIAYVASGQMDVYYEEAIRLWDVAAGIALIEAAGGVVQMKRNASAMLAYDVWAAGSAALIPG